MPTNSKKTIIRRKSNMSVEEVRDNEINESKDKGCCSISKERLYRFLPYILAGLIILGYFGYKAKDKFIVAIVDKKPIFAFQLSKKLNSTYGKETLENMIVEKLIAEEARKKGISISEDDIKTEIDKLSKNLGNGMTIEDALKLQGVTLADFKEQLKIRLQVNKILEKEVTVEDKEIDEFIKINGKTMVATSGAEQRTEARESLLEQKISEKIQTWVQDLLVKAKITRLLK